MKNIFAVTDNVEMFMALVDSLENRHRFMPGLGLVFGEPGLGKSRTANWYCDQIAVKKGNERKPVFIRALATDTPRAFLYRLVMELGQAPEYSTADIYLQAEHILREIPRLIIVDEIEKLFGNWRGIESLRDLTDQTGSPILMIGEEKAIGKLGKYPRINYRMKAHIMRFKALSEADLARFSKQVCEVDLDATAVKQIFEITGGRIGDVLPELYKAEKIAKANDLNVIKGSHLIRRAA